MQDSVLLPKGPEQTCEVTGQKHPKVVAAVIRNRWSEVPFKLQANEKIDVKAHRKDKSIMQI